MRHYGGASRAELFARLDLPALRPLPAVPFEYAEWKHARVNLDYHIAVDHHAYSVPHALVHEPVEVRLTETTLEVLHAAHRVAPPRRCAQRGGFTTDPAHMPKAHQAHHEWRPSRFIAWAGTIGPQTAALVAAIPADRPAPEAGYRSSLGTPPLAKRDDAGRIEAACARALAAGARSYRHVDAILRGGLDLPTDTPRPTPAPAHENIRGRDYYH